MVTAAAAFFAMFEFQTSLIFPVDAVPAAGPMPARAVRLSVRTDDGQTLEGIHIPPDGPDSTRTLILGFGGNAWNGQDVAEYLHEVYPSTISSRSTIGATRHRPVRRPGKH